jgi:hypothetical protein
MRILKRGGAENAEEKQPENSAPSATLRFQLLHLTAWTFNRKPLFRLGLILTTVSDEDLETPRR